MIHKFKHAIIVFGGLAGIEDILQSQEDMGSDPNEIFDVYLNTCPD